MAVNGTTILQLPIASGITADETWIAVAVYDGSSWVSKRVAADTVGDTGSFVPTSRAVNTGYGLSGGGTLASDLTLEWAPDEVSAKADMVVADTFLILNAEASDAPYQVTFSNAMKAISGLTDLAIPNLSDDYLAIRRGADGTVYKINPSALGLAAGNMPAGGTTGQTLVKASNVDYDTEWSSGGFLDQLANVVFSGPASGAAAAPAFRALVGADLPDPGAASKGGVQSYAAVSNQFMTSISTSGVPASAQPAFSNLSGTAAVSQGGTAGTTAQTARAGLNSASVDAGAALGLLTNPFFEISQEFGQVLQSPVGSGLNISDQMLVLATGGAIVCSGQNISDPFSGVDGFRSLRNANRIIVTTAEAGATISCLAQQVVEGTTLKSLAWGTADAEAVCLVCIVSVSVAGTYVFGFKNAANNRSYLFTKVLAADTPTVILERVPGDTSGTWETGAVAALRIRVCGVAPGTTGTPGSWQAGNFNDVAGSTPWQNTLGATLTIAYFQVFPSGVLPWSSASEITGEALQLLLNMRRPYDYELRRCQRYYQKSYNYDDAPAAVTTVGALSAQALYTGNFNRLPAWLLRPEMRTNPTITIYSPATGASGKIANITTAADLDATSEYIGKKAASIYVNNAVATEGDVLACHVVANARM